MYLNFFGLRHTPFGDVDSASLFWTPKRRALAEQFRHAIAERQGMVVLTGEDGSGKTTFVRGVLEGMASHPMKVLKLSSEKLSFPMLLRTMLRELGETIHLVDALPNTSAASQTAQPPAHPLAPLENIAPLIRTLHTALLAHHSRQGGLIVLVIENAHQLPVQTLKDFHWLSLLETPEGKLLQTIFVGNAKLSLKLEMPQLHALQRRIVTSGELAPLTLEESFVYLLTRLRAKSLPRSASSLFSVEALRLLARHGKGNLRTLNSLATAALRAAATRRQKPISGQLMLEVIAELRTLPMMNRPSTSVSISRSRPTTPRHRPVPRPKAHPLRAASVGAIAAAFLLAISYYGSKTGWQLGFPNPVKIFRSSTVAQAAPGSEASITLPVSNLVDPARSQEIDKPEQPLSSTSSKEKRRDLSEIRGRSRNNAKPLSASPRIKDERMKKLWQQVPNGTSPLDNKEDTGILGESLPGKVLYKSPPDPASNNDRLFDD